MKRPSLTQHDRIIHPGYNGGGGEGKEMSLWQGGGEEWVGGGESCRTRTEVQ